MPRFLVSSTTPSPPRSPRERRQIFVLYPTELDRVGLHSERGNESPRHSRMLMAGHDLWHLDQMKRYVEAAATMG